MQTSQKYDGQSPFSVQADDDEKIAEAVAAERKRCANLVPTTWLDPLLSGKDVAKPPLDCRAVEALLRGIQDRIRNSKSE